MAKPTENLDWATNELSADVVETTPAQKLSGIVEGSTWGRQYLNWMFLGISKWITFVKDEVRSNTENDGRFVQHTEVVNTLTSTSTTNPLSALQGKSLKTLADTALVAGTTGAQGRTNTENDGRFVVESRFKYGVVTLGLDASTTINLGATVLTGQVSINNNLVNNVDPPSITWSGNSITITNSQSTLDITYFAIVAN